MNDTHHILKNASTIVVKIGSALISDIQKGTIKTSWISALSDDIHKFITDHKKVIMVSSGGVALGRSALNIPTTLSPGLIPLELKQAASSIGQFHMFSAYYQAFLNHDITCAQILLTLSETENRRMHLNARSTLETLLGRGILPIINENDTVSTEEIRFGDNDRLAVRVAQMVAADAVILLSTTDGLYTNNPSIDPEAEHIATIENLTDAHMQMAGDAVPGLSTGGMKSKMVAARSAAATGIHTIITDGQDNHALNDLYTNKNKKNTIIKAQKDTQTAKKSWIYGHIRPKGQVIIDNGAVNALKQGKSLLPVGITRYSGNFERGDAITVHDANMNQIAVGLTAFGSNDLTKILGKTSTQIRDILGYDGRPELIHRNDLVLS